MFSSPFPDAPFVSAAAPSFATLLLCVEADVSLSATRRRDLASSVRRVAAILRPGCPLTDLPAEPEWCRPRLAKVSPVAQRISEKTWATLRSNLAQAFAVADIRERRFTIVLTGEWARLWDLLLAEKSMQLSTGLARFPRFCQQHGLSPVEVDDGTLKRYRDALCAEELNRDPALAAYYAARAWNLAADLIPDWPRQRLTAPDRKRTYALPWSRFPVLEADVDAWLATRENDDIFSLDAPKHALGPRTCKLRKGSIQRYVSALIHAGTPEDGLTLATIVEPELVKVGLRWLMSRTERKKGGGIWNIAIAIKMAARHARLDPAKLKQLEQFARGLSADQRGMTLKNRERMQPFKQKAMVRELILLPGKLMQNVGGVRHPARAAALAETALAIAILTICPIRFDNLCNLELTRHLLLRGHGKQARTQLWLPASMVKNDMELRFDLPPPLALMIDRFTKSHRPVLAQVSSRYLFTKRSDDAPIGATTLRRRVMEALLKNLGVDLTPHNFRHLAGLIFLNAQPGQYETVRRLLAHKAGSTAIDHYVGLEADAAHRAYAELLADLGAKNG